MLYSAYSTVSNNVKVVGTHELLGSRPRGSRIGSYQWFSIRRLFLSNYSIQSLPYDTVWEGQAISSVGERFLHTEEVTGSIPVSPTIKIIYFFNSRLFSWFISNASLAPPFEPPPYHEEMQVMAGGLVCSPCHSLRRRPTPSGTWASPFCDGPQGVRTFTSLRN